MIRLLLRLAIIAGLLYGGVVLFYDWLQNKLQVAPASSQPAIAKRQTGKVAAHPEQPAASPDYQIIVQRNIFQAQVAASEGIQPAEKQVQLDPTSLNLVLQGTITGTDRDARAIIVDGASKQEDIYHLGDSVQGALIRKIERGRIVLEVNGRSEVLLITDRKGDDSAPPAEASGAAGMEPAGASAAPDVQSRVPVAQPHRIINFRDPAETPRQVAQPEKPLSVEGEGESPDTPEIQDGTAEEMPPPVEEAAPQQ